LKNEMGMIDYASAKPIADLSQTAYFAQGF